MAESGKVRLVRCPRCKNILPEFPDVPVYRCGKCDVILQAKKNRKSGGDAKSETSNGESVEMVSMESGDLFENEAENSNNRNDISDIEVKSNGSSLNSGKKGAVAERNPDHSKARADKWVIDTALDMNTDRDELGIMKMAMETGELKSHVPKIAGTSWRSDRSSDWQFRRNPRMDIGRGMGYSHSIHSDVGASDYGYGDPLRDREEYFEPNQARVTRQLDELKDRFERSCDVADKPKEKVLLNRRVFHGEAYDDDWFSTTPFGGRSSMPSFMRDNFVPEPPYFQRYDEPFPYNGRHEKGMQGSHHPFMFGSNQNPRFEDFYGPQMLRQRPPPDQAPVQYQRQPPHAYFPGGYMGPDSNPYEPYIHGLNSNLHHPSCSCFHCYPRHQQVAGSIPATAIFNRSFPPDIPNEPMSYDPEHPAAFHLQAYNPRTSTPPPMTSYDSRSHSRLPSEVNMEKSDAGHQVPQRGVLLNDRRCCRPFAGGAPFITCCSCFELLKLPKKIRLVMKNQQKIRCGACSKVIILAVNRHGIVASIHEETEEISKEIDDSTNQPAHESPSKSRDHVNQYSENFSSEDFDNTAYDYQSMDRKAGSVQTDRGLNSMAQNLHSSTSPPENEASQKGLFAPSEAGNPLEQPTKPIRSPPPPGSTLQELFDYSSNNIQPNHFGNGNHSSHSDHKKVISPKTVSRQSSLKDVSLVTETEVSYNEFSNTGVSQDSMDASREHDQLRINKGEDTFLAGIIEGLRESSSPSQTIEQGRNIVMVNDHVIPDHLVQKAEKLAGPIRPGEYWYDFYCGFWGVMGGRCLGIIPPFIEEFKYPMPINCAAGNTGVWVNERELNQKDLDLLVSRGLPATRDKEYVIDVSGRVRDRDSGEELKSLGKLAPTVEKAKRGFGMKVPSSAA